MTATSRIGTGRSAEFADSASGGNGLALTFTEINYTGGIEAAPGAVYADVTGVTISFNLPITGTVQFFGSATALSNPFTQGNYIGLGLNVNGTDYAGCGTGGQAFNAAGGGNLVTLGFTSGDAITFALALNLAAGAYTVKLRFLGNGYLESSASFPTKLIALYPTLTGPIAAASPITSQEAQNATGTPTTNATTTYAVIPGTLINLTLSGIQTVFFSGLATADVVTDLNAQLGVRIDGIDYDGTCSVHDNLIAVTVDGSVDVTKAISLTAGAHTAQLVIRRAEGVVAGSAQVFNSSTKPSRLTAVYTTPQVAGDGVVEGARVTKSTSTVLAASTPTVLTWDTVLNNSNGVYSGGSPTRLTAITGGWYTVFGSITWNTYAFTTTEWSLKARKNGSTIVGKDLFHTTSAGAYSIFPEQNKVNELVYLNAGDYIELIAETTEPSNRNTIISASEYSPIFSMVLAQIGSGSGGGSGLGFSEVIETGGQFDTASATFVDVTGTTLNFATTAMGNVTVKAQFTGIRDAADTDISAHYALKIDGTDYNMGGLKLSLAGGFNGFWVQSFEKTIALAAGAHTAVLRLRSNGANNSHIASDTDKPTIVTAHYAI